MQVRSRQRGASLIEVMVAVLIFSVGLIGVAGLLIMATRSNHAAYLRTQVTFLAHSMADRMRANPMGVWSASYNSDSYPIASTQQCDTGCTPSQLAAHDQGMWSRQLSTFLPDATASIKCTNGGAGYAPSADQMAMRPPYGGSCSMKITWSERAVSGKIASGSEIPTQTFAWEFQP